MATDNEITRNFRPILGTKLFRSSNIDLVTEKGALKLKHECGVGCIVDVRSGGPRGPRGGGCLLDRYYAPVAVSRDNQGGKLKYDPTPATSTQGSGSHSKTNVMENDKYCKDINDETVNGLQRNETNSTPGHKGGSVFGNHYYAHFNRALGRVFVGRLPWYIKLRALGLAPFDLMFGSNRTKLLVMQYAMLPGGLPQIYRDVIDHCGKEICTVLELLCRPENVPAVVCCSLGKDRTGVLAALCQEVCGVDREVIIEDYAKSRTCLGEDMPEEIYVEARGFNLPDSFMESPPEWMRELLQYIDREYGSPLRYLEHIGFDSDKQARLRELIKN